MSTSGDALHQLAEQCIAEANALSGGLVLKAARRAKNTNELLGMVLSRFIVQTELDGQAAAWCFLDDYAVWLGRREEGQIADLMVLIPSLTSAGLPLLDIVVTEAKFITSDNLAEQAKRSEQQLRDTLRQLEDALLGDTASLDQDILLSRLADMLVARLEASDVQAEVDVDEWRTLIRQRECHIRIRGYSHVFVYAPFDCPPGQSKRIAKTQSGVQEIFTPSQVRSLLQCMQSGNASLMSQLRDRQLLESICNASRPIPAPAVSSDVSEMEDATTSAITDGSAAEAGCARGQAGHPDVLPDGHSTPQAEPGDAIQQVPEHVDPDSVSVSTVESIGATSFPAASEVLRYLDQVSTRFKSNREEGLTWLKDTQLQLRRAFLSRQLPFSAYQDAEPILTPNAGIFRLKGSTQLTVPIVEAKAQEIYTSDGLHIVSVAPEPGCVRVMVSRSRREILHTETVMSDFIRRHSDSGGESVLAGVREEDGSLLTLDPLRQPHTLVAGATNSGKSVLMQNIILSIAATRSPSEAKIFLIDPKQVDYTSLEHLPHIRAGSSGIIDRQEDALSLLESAVAEMERRYTLFKEAGRGVSNISAYRTVTKKPLATWWIIHDEFADWMQTDEYRNAIPALVNRLSVKARAAGIFLIFAAQRPDNQVFPVQMRDQLGNRLVLKVASTGTSEIALGERGAEKLLGAGHMLARIATEMTPVFAQVPYIDPVAGIPPLVDAIIRDSGTVRSEQ